MPARVIVRERASTTIMSVRFIQSALTQTSEICFMCTVVNGMGHVGLEGRGHRVLVVDDHADTVEVLSVMFGMLGYEARGELRGRAALRAARAFDPDLIVLDLGLPDLDGFQVVNALRACKTLCNRFIIAVTGWARPHDAQRAIEAGFDAYFTKPIDLRKIRQVLCQVDARGAMRD